MKKKFLTAVFALLAFGAYSQVTFTTTGGSTIRPGHQGDTLDMTPCNGLWSAGAAWADPRRCADFTKCFTLRFTAMFDDVYGTGGDGICPVFGSHFTPTTPPNGMGGYLGYYDDPGFPHNTTYDNSLALEIDNFNDCPYTTLHDCGPSAMIGDHNHFSENADATILGGGAGETVTATSGFSTGPGSIKDAMFHNYMLSWNPTTQTMTFFVDGIPKNYIVSPFNVAGTPFIDPTCVPWGFTAGYAAACSHQLITNISLTPGDCGPKDSTQCDELCYWRLLGNNANVLNFIGTLNPEDFRIRTNNTQWAVIDKVGETGIHVTTPSTTLDVDGSPVGSYGTPSGVRMRTLPPGQGCPLVVDPSGYVYVDGNCSKNPGGPGDLGAMPRTNDMTELQNQVNELKQQIAEMRSQLGIAGPQATNGSISVNPNPTTGQVTVSYNMGGNYINGVVKVTDISGKTILTQPLTGSSGQTSLMIPGNVASGNVIVSLVVDGKAIATQKVVLLGK